MDFVETLYEGWTSYVDLHGRSWWGSKGIPTTFLFCDFQREDFKNLPIYLRNTQKHGTVSENLWNFMVRLKKIKCGIYF